MQLKKSILILSVLAVVLYNPAIQAAAAPAVQSQKQAKIPFNQLGAEVDAKYNAQAAVPLATKNGFKLASKLQALEAEVTAAGLTITSFSKSEGGGAFLIMPVAVNGMKTAGKQPKPQAADGGILLDRGFVTERFSATSDGIRQDFIIPAPAKQALPGNAKTDLVLSLAITGAKVENFGSDGTGSLVTLASGRKLVYNRLQVTDAQGRELPGRMEVKNNAAVDIIVAAAGATYPITIDPTITDADWVSMNPGIPGVIGSVNALARDSSGNLYVGGSFPLAGTVAANNIAKWDGSVWSALGSGMNGTVNALAIDSSGKLYAGGSFTAAGGVADTVYIAKWDGTIAAWSALGSGMNGTVNALAIDSSGKLYAGGVFKAAGSVTNTAYIAKWDGATAEWSALGSGMGGTVNALAIDSSGKLYAGGSFTTAGTTTVSNIAKWDGTNWSALGAGLSGSFVRVYALAIDSSNNLYAGGSFTTAGATTVSNIAKWNGSAWLALGSGFNNMVLALAFNSSTNKLYAGGYFRAANVLYIATWNGSAWSTLGTVTGSSVNAFAIDTANNFLYAGGSFKAAGGVPAKCIVKWTGSTATWSALGSGTDGMVNALAMDSVNNLLYAGGYFTTAVGGVNTAYIAKWDGSSWSGLGTGMGGDFVYVSALALDSINNLLYAGGEFTTAGGVTVNNIAKWNGTNWSALGSGMNSYVDALAIDSANNLLYAGGGFSASLSIPVNHIAKWDGTTWSALGSGMDSDVNALVMDSENNLLYAGGNFTNAGSVTTQYIAAWDGTSWAALGSGMGGSNLNVYALAIDTANNFLYAGGDFTNAGGVENTAYIAQWDGTTATWSALGSGTDGRVRTLAFDSVNNLLYAGGSFTITGGVGVNKIATWDGMSWSALGTGMNGYVYALAIDATNHLLYAGGDFTAAGGKISPYIANCNLPGVALVISKSGTGAGTVTSSPAGIDCGSDCTEVYKHGADVTLTATADEGSTFAGWSGACTGTGDCTVTVNDQMTITANFNLISTTSTISVITTTTTTAVLSTTTSVVTTTTGPCPAQKVLGADNPNLENLRALRDGGLAQSAIGRKLIIMYYSNAAGINSALKRSPALRAAARRVLEVIAPMVGKGK